MNSTEVTDELHEAIRTLEEFSRHSEKTSLKPIQKTIDLVRGLILKPDHKVLQAAIEVVNRKRLYIQRLKKVGNPAEQKLAEYFLMTIDGFNASLEQHKVSQGLVNFFLKKEKDLSKIDLPQPITVQQHYPENSPTEWLSRKISAGPSAIHLPKQSAELFQMKVISLLERYGIASKLEARNFVKSSPIVTSMDEDQSRCILTQTITLFPGQTVMIKGSSELDPQTQTINQLFPDTFCVLLQSTQTGFPHPSQRNGWTLANQLIPECPQRQDLLPLLAPFYQNKKQAIKELLPNGKWVSKAKQMIRLRRAAFVENRQNMIALHKQLATAIIEAAPSQLVSGNTKEIIHSFYSTVEKHPHPFDLLSDTYQIIADVFITKPHDKLIEAIMEGNASEGQGDFSFLSCESAHKMMTDEIQSSLKRSLSHASPLGQERLDYIRCLGSILGHSSKAIMLQYFSEDLIFPPPELNAFEQKLQSMAYQHVEDFVHELASDWDHHSKEASEWAIHHVHEQIKQDIHHWSIPTGSPISDELAHYYTKRHLSP